MYKAKGGGRGKERAQALPLAIVVNYLRFGHRPRVLHDRPADRVDPLLLLLLRIGDEEHGVLIGGDLEGEGLVEDVLGALHGEAAADGDDAARLGEAGDAGVLEPEELPLLEHEPAAAPRLDVVALLAEPAGALRLGPELDSGVVVGVRRLESRRSPEALHPRVGQRRERESEEREERDLQKGCSIRGATLSLRRIVS